MKGIRNELAEHLIEVGADYLTDDGRIIRRTYKGNGTTPAWRIDGDDYFYESLFDAYNDIKREPEMRYFAISKTNGSEREITYDEVMEYLAGYKRTTQMNRAITHIMKHGGRMEFMFSIIEVRYA